MIYFGAMFIGVILVFCGLLFTMQALSALKKTLNAINALQEDAQFINISSLRYELDELNYSYYEILDDTSKRLDAIEIILNQENVKKGIDGQQLVQQAERQSDLDAFEFVQTKVATHSDKTELPRRIIIKKMIAEGMSDQDIAKVLGIGVGEVGVLRRTEHKF